jgi:hypothetical protein
MAASGVFVSVNGARLAGIMAGRFGDGVTASAEKTQLPITYFAVGEGGYLTVGASKVPKVPSAAQTDTEASIAPATVATSATGLRFQKNFGALDVTDDLAGTLTAVVKLDSVEANLDNNSKLTGNAGNPPQLFELCIFGYDGTAVAYCTFDEINKNAGQSVTITVQINY